MNLRPRGEYEKVDSGFDPLPILKLVIKAWPIYVLMLFCGLAMGHYLVKNAKPKYQIDASLKVNRSFEIPTYGNEENITGLRIFSKICNIYNYIGRINTRDVLSKAYRLENLEVQLLKKNKRLIEDRPFIIHHSTHGTVPVNTKFQIQSINKDSCRLTMKSGHFQRYNYSVSTSVGAAMYSEIDTVLSFNDSLPLPGTFICIEKTKHFKQDSLSFEFEDLSATLDDYQQRLRIKTLNKGASAITISITTDQAAKDKAFISSIMKTFAEKDLQIKKALTTSTLSFLDAEQKLISDSLIGHRTKLAHFKSNNRFMNLDMHATTVLNRLEQIDNELAKLATKERYYSFLLTGILNQAAIDTLLAPVMHTEQDVFLIELVTQYRKSQLDLEEIKFYAGPKNPNLLKKKAEIEWLKTSISEGLSNLIAKIQIEKEQLIHRESKEQKAFQKLPAQERENIHLERLLARDLSQLKYLQKKSSSTGLAMHTLLPDVEILQDPLIKGNKSVTPLNTVAYAFLAIIALCIPFLFQQISTSIKRTIMVTDDIQMRSDYPLFAVLPTFKKGSWLKRKTGVKADKSEFSEAMVQLACSPEIKSEKTLKVAISGSRPKVGVSTFIQEFIPLMPAEKGLLFLSFIPSDQDMHVAKDFLNHKDIPEPSPFHPIVKMNMSSLLDEKIIETDEAKNLIKKLCSGNWNLLVELPDLKCPVIALTHIEEMINHHWIICKEMHSSLSDLQGLTRSSGIETSVIYNHYKTVVPWWIQSKNTRLKRWALPTVISHVLTRRRTPKYRTERQ